MNIAIHLIDPIDDCIGELDATEERLRRLASAIKDNAHRMELRTKDDFARRERLLGWALAYERCAVDLGKVSSAIAGVHLNFGRAYNAELERREFA